MNLPGSGPSLIDATPWLRDAADRHRQILDVVERDSVIEGLPPFTEAVRQMILARLQRMNNSTASLTEPDLLDG
jgi:coenzyme F420-reducing hydrogenase gamma subunit